MGVKEAVEAEKNSGATPECVIARTQRGGEMRLRTMGAAWR